MNQDQIEIVKQYLKIETSYAVIINGGYGIGKTHFYKNELSPMINEVSISRDERIKFSPIHISLFGYKSLEEIQTAIFIELYPLLKNKKLKLAAGIGKSIIRGIAQINKAGDIDKYIADVSQDANDWLKYDQLVICFDDLDRKSDSLDLRDVFGFINSLVENEGAKILIIANETELLKDNNYSSDLREKVIGVSIQYDPDPNHIFQEIVNERYKSPFKIYYEFLEENKDLILDRIKINNNNFRNLIFFLEHFRELFYPLINEFVADKDFEINKDKKLVAILNFTLAVSIEYKLGHLNSTNLDEVKSINENPLAGVDISKFLAASHTNKEDDEEVEISYIDSFKKKYFENKQYYFFKSIFQFITGLKAFNVKYLKEELEGYFVVKDGQIPPHEKILSDLSYMGCLNLSDSEYRSLTREMLKYVDSGSYDLRQYGTVFHFASRFSNLLNYNLSSLKSRFKKGIRKGKSHYQYNYDLGFHMTISDSTEFKDDVLEVINYCIKINDEIKDNSESDELEKLLDLFDKNHEKFIETVDERDSQWRFSPFWIEFKVSRLGRKIKKLSNEQIWKLGHYFKNRYRRDIYEKLFPEKEFIIALRQEIDDGTKARERRTLKNASLNYLSETLKSCEANFLE